MLTLPSGSRFNFTGSLESARMPSQRYDPTTFWPTAEGLVPSLGSRVRLKRKYTAAVSLERGSYWETQTGEEVLSCKGHWESMLASVLLIEQAFMATTVSSDLACLLHPGKVRELALILRIRVEILKLPG